MDAVPALVAAMSDEEFHVLRDQVRSATGIALPIAKKPLLAARLLRRLQALNLESYAAYSQLLSHGDPAEHERTNMISCITTHKTSFFRERHHFDFLTTLLRDEVRKAEPLRIWSAGCSTGEEAYSIAMTLHDGLGPEGAARVKVVATDIDEHVLGVARRGVYAAANLDDVPAAMRHKYFLRGSNAQAGFVRVNDEIRRAVEFRPLNLAAIEWPQMGAFDLIFCRNVMIYFDHAQRERIVTKLAGCLVAGGHLIVGHSETLRWAQDKLSLVGNTVYRRARPATAMTPVVRGPSAAVNDRRIGIGELAVGANGEVIATTLGSCVAACLFDPLVGIGGMNHFVLPGDGQSDRSARYGIHAMELLINGLMKLGAERRRLRAKLFGGNQVLLGLAAHDVATRNVDFVRGYLADEGIPVMAERLGGAGALFVRFETGTGKAYAKVLSHALAPAPAEEQTNDVPAPAYASEAIIWGTP